MKNTKLEYLNISGNYIQWWGAKAFAKCIEHNNTLKEINFATNHIHSGILAICESLKKNTSIHSLSNTFF